MEDLLGLGGETKKKEIICDYANVRKHIVNSYNLNDKVVIASKA